MLRTPACQLRRAREQQGAASHYELLATLFATFERNIRDQLVRLGSGAGFDPARDIEAITGNRWPHGYAYEYHLLWDPEWPEGKRPQILSSGALDALPSPTQMLLQRPTPTTPLINGYRAVPELLSS